MRKRLTMAMRRIPLRSTLLAPVLLLSCGAGDKTDSTSVQSTEQALSIVSRPTPPTLNTIPTPRLGAPELPASSTVGTLPGTPGVSPSGAFTYTIPLDVPDGVAGMSPTLSLNYSSSAGNGPLGRGWSVAGASSVITLCRRTIASDGLTAGVQFDGTDAYCLDGAKLVAVPAAASVNGAGPPAGAVEYRTEDDSIARIVPNDVPGKITQFTVYLKNGRIRTYAANPIPIPNALTVTRDWYLSQEEDRSGNSINYSYTDFGNNEIHITDITYTTTSSATWQRRVAFLYGPKDAADESYHFANGIQTGETQQLQHIQMWAPKPTSPSTSAIAWDYNLAYEQGELGHTLLASVQKAGALGSALLTKNFNWQTGNPAAQAAWPSGPSGGITYNSGDPIGDFNGDGFDDVLNLATGNLYFGSATGLQSAIATTLTLPVVTGAKASKAGVIPVDFNGTGTIGLMVGVQECTKAACTPSAVMETWDKGTGKFVIQGTVPAAAYVPTAYLEPSVLPIVADMNGDGLVDLVSSRQAESGDPSGTSTADAVWTVFLNTGNYTFNTTLSIVQPNGSFSGGLTIDAGGQIAGTCLGVGIVADFNGNGRQGVDVWSNSSCPDDYNVALGLTEPQTGQILTLNETLVNNVVQYKLAFQPGFPLALVASNVNSTSGQTEGAINAQLGDFNGDGLKDVAYIGTAGSSSGLVVNGSKVALNQGNYNWQLMPWTDPFLNAMVQQGVDPMTGYTYNLGTSPVTIADVNRDGKDDLIFATDLLMPGTNVPFESFGVLYSLGATTTGAVLSFAQDIYNSLQGANVLPFTDATRATLCKNQVNSTCGGFYEVLQATAPNNMWEQTFYPTLTPGHDFDGDGKQDLLFAQPAPGSAGGVPLAPATGAVPLLAAMSADVDLLLSVQDGVSPQSLRTSVMYGRTNSGGDGSVCTFPSACLNHGLPVVAELSGLDLPDAEVFYQFNGPRMDLQGRGFLGFDTKREWFPLRPMERTTIYDNATVDAVTLSGRSSWIYPNALKPETVTEVTPIVTENAVWFSSPPQPTSATAQVKSTSYNYQLTLTNNGSTYFTYLDQAFSQMWETPVAINWGAGAQVHIPNVPAAGASNPVLRTHSDTFKEDVYRNVTDHHSSTSGGISSATVTTFQPSAVATWLFGLPSQIRTLSATPSVPTPPWTATTFTYQTNGLPYQSIVEPTGTSALNSTTTYGFDANGRMTSKVTTTPSESLARSTFIAYADVSGEGVYPSSTWDGIGIHAWLWVNPALGTTWATVDANGAETSYITDDLGRPQQTAYATGAVTTQTLAPYINSIGQTAGTIVTTASSDGSGEIDTLDQLGKPTSRATSWFDGAPATNVEYITYDPFERIILASNPNAPTVLTTVSRDSLNRTVTITTPDGTSSHNAYNDAAFTTTTTTTGANVTAADPARSSVITRDVDGRIVASAQLNGPGGTQLALTQYTYGPFDKLATVTAQGATTSYQYDMRGRMTGMSTPDSTPTTSLAGCTLPSGCTGTAQLNGFGEAQILDSTTSQDFIYHDADGRVFESFSSVDGWTTRTWDNRPYGIGQVGNDASPDGTTTSYGYDTIGRPSVTSTVVNGVSYTLANTYDALGRLRTVTYPAVTGLSPFVATYSYNNAQGYLTEIDATTPSGSSAPVWNVVDRTLTGALAQAQFGNGIEDTRTYDPATLRLNTDNASGLYAKTYQYYYDGRVQSVADSVNPRTESYSYDALARLTSWGVSGIPSVTPTATTFTYDSGNLGNLVTVVQNGNVTDQNIYGGMSAKGFPHALSGRNGLTYTYDARGRRTGSSTGTVSLSSVTYTDFDLPRSYTTSGITTSFLYSANGRRVMKSSSSGTTVSLAELYERRIGAGTSGADLHVFFINGPEGRLAQVEFDAGTSIETRAYMHTDPLGSVSTITNASGVVTNSQYHDPFGKRVNVAGLPLFVFPGATYDVHDGFAGHDYDDDLGLINMGGRMYDPATRRFLTPDPFVTHPLVAQSYNPYSYVHNDPVNVTDPSGYQEEEGLEEDPAGGGWGGNEVGGDDGGDDDDDDTAGVGVTTLNPDGSTSQTWATPTSTDTSTTPNPSASIDDTGASTVPTSATATTEGNGTPAGNASGLSASSTVTCEGNCGGTTPTAPTPDLLYNPSIFGPRPSLGERGALAQNTVVSNPQCTSNCTTVVNQGGGGGGSIDKGTAAFITAVAAAVVKVAPTIDALVRTYVADQQLAAAAPLTAKLAQRLLTGPAASLLQYVAKVGFPSPGPGVAVPANDVAAGLAARGGMGVGGATLVAVAAGLVVFFYSPSLNDLDENGYNKR